MLLVHAISAGEPKEENNTPNNSHWVVATIESIDMLVRYAIGKRRKEWEEEMQRKKTNRFRGPRFCLWIVIGSQRTDVCARGVLYDIFRFCMDNSPSKEDKKPYVHTS